MNNVVNLPKFIRTYKKNDQGPDGFVNMSFIISVKEINDKYYEAIVFTNYGSSIRIVKKSEFDISCSGVII